MPSFAMVAKVAKAKAGAAEVKKTPKKVKKATKAVAEKIPPESLKRAAKAVPEKPPPESPPPEDPPKKAKSSAAAFVPLDPEADTEVRKSLRKKRKKGGSDTGVGKATADGGASSVVYIGRIPHGFYEDQLKGFFSQFGTIKNLRVSRNKKTGKSKHYAFMEFESPEVAEIVAECMHNYLLFGSILQCNVMPKEKIHPETFKGANRKFVVVNWQKRAKAAHNKERTVSEEKRRVTRLLKADERRRKKLAEAGIEYDFEGFKAVVPPRAKKIKFEEED